MRRLKRFLELVVLAVVVGWFGLFGFIAILGLIDGVQARRAGTATAACLTQRGEPFREAFQRDVACYIASKPAKLER